MAHRVCVHGHFYQPPRENPWLEAVEVQDSAEPYHDWNARITAECYRPNAWARILDEENFITGIVSNYSRISFDFGPTLLSWLETQAPDVYRAVLDADRDSRRRFSGHGSAMAQAYNHTILPLSNSRDKRTQILWGLRDFERRFGRRAEGLWLPETAVDYESLALLAEQGVRFTVLAPGQAKETRARGASEWDAVGPEGIDTARPYAVPVPGSAEIAVFFYDGPLSHDIAFAGVLHQGRLLADRLAARFRDAPADPPLLSHVATDGETYGHHHRYGEMALAHALRLLEERDPAILTNYGEFLAQHPPEFEATVHENTSWSCAHGVERWRSNCGCNAGRIANGQQEWRTPLRAAFDWLRDSTGPLYEEEAGRLFRDPWGARNDYVQVLLDRSDDNVSGFLSRHAGRPLAADEQVRALRLLELERQLQQMYTSCGWFFDDPTGIETVQTVQYASRALQLAEEIRPEGREAELLRRLEAVRSNFEWAENGRRVYETQVRPMWVDPRKVCAHYALSSLFESYNERARVYCYDVRSRERISRLAGTARLVAGQVDIVSRVTRESGHFTYGALYIGGTNLFGGVRPFLGDARYHETMNELVESVERGDIPEVIRRVDRHFGQGTYTLGLLFRDEQRKIVDLMLVSTIGLVTSAYRGIYETVAPLLRHLAEVRSPAPRALRAAVEFYLNQEIHNGLEREEPDFVGIGGWMREVERMQLAFEEGELALAWARTLERLMRRFAEAPGEDETLARLERATELEERYPGWVDLSDAQNRFFRLLGTEALARRREDHTPPGQAWNDRLRTVARRLRVRLP